jgi:EpsD family peptidyl-prolyl cis-trans isomerase
MLTTKLGHRLRLAALALALAASAGCGESRKAATQVAAKVNSDEITVHQIGQVLAGNQEIGAEALPEAKREALDRLIDRQLLRQQAIKKKLDRSPSVMLAIEAAKSEILVRAYLQKIAAAQPEPSADEVKGYYADNRALFAERRLFSLEEIVVVPQPGLAAKLRERAAKARSMREIAAWLKSENASFTEGRGVRAAEHLPLEVLPQLQAMRPGELRVIEGGRRLNVLRLVSVQAAPVDEPTADRPIRQALANQQLARTVAAEMAQLRQRSKIEYVGGFGNEAAAASPAPAPTEDPAQLAQAPGKSYARAVRGLLR